MHTKDFLAEALEKANLPEMAERARAGYYHDFLSPLPTPCLQLDIDLMQAVKAGNAAAKELRVRHHNGEFDASKEESDDWAASPDGQAAMAELVRSSRRPGKKFRP